MLPSKPTVLILKKLKGVLDSIDWTDVIWPGQTMTIRHARNRFSTEAERPCIAIRWVTDVIDEGNENEAYLTPDEKLVQMTVVLEIDYDLPADFLDDDDLDTRGPDEIDETGLETPTQIAGACMTALQSEDSDMQNWVDWVAYGGIADDPDSTSDEGRMDLTLTIKYRVRTDDPSVLLAAGVNTP